MTIHIKALKMSKFVNFVKESGNGKWILRPWDVENVSKMYQYVRNIIIAVDTAMMPIHEKNDMNNY